MLSFAVKTKTSAEQMEIITRFMEQHGDLNRIQELPPVSRIEQMQKWAELTAMLNETGHPRPTVKWKKVWSDLKNNTKKKYRKLKTEGVGPPMSHLELRVLRVLGAQEEGDKVNHTDGDNDDDDNNDNENNDTQPIQIELKREPDETQPRRFFYSVNRPVAEKRPSSASSYAASSSMEPPVKRKRSDIDSLTRKYFEFEKKREEMLHEREMARIKQEEQRLGIYSRLVSVLESLAPCVKKFLDRTE